MQTEIEKGESFFEKDISTAIINFKSFIKNEKRKIIVGIKTKNILEGVKKLFEENEIYFQFIASFKDVSNLAKNEIGICIYDSEDGIKTDNFIIIQEKNIIGSILASVKKRKEINLNRLTVSLNQFNKNDLVVHKEYGVGIFEGVFTLETKGMQYDAVKIIYQNSDALYVPIYNINEIKKYGSQVPEEEKINLLDKLGSDSFKIKKAKAKSRIFKIAEELMKTAAKRSMQKSIAFIPQNDLYEKFCANFPFVLTEDQENAIQDVMQDLSSTKPMERLICGDVGFGKTEVAMRACFAVCKGEKINAQVAIVVPTTILANQHYANFIKRFQGVEIKIAELSRNVEGREKLKILEEIARGEIDIVIGTHALFSDKLKFKNLGLVVIDEEQHFGVKQKDKLKEGREEIHFLSLSATPIPRTLQMSLSGLRDISIIATPPFDRLLPKTFVMPYEKIVLANAITREKARSGRVFFVCPRIADLEVQAEKLQSVLPEIKFGIAHGRMTAKNLDDVMLSFFEGKIDVLVTTSIVESGIDISFANTIIIYNANMFGLSSLYQLKGRVGRGSVQSYCYFIIDEKRLEENENAKMRLNALANIKSLGAGFKIAGTDMDIRGAGNLVGEDQSGKMEALGVELYEEMLKEAVMKVKVGINEGFETEEDFAPEIKIGMPFMIPEYYIPDFNLRLEFYRRISSIQSIEALYLIKEEMKDRFGEMPIDAQNLIDIINLKIKCKELGILKLEAGSKGVLIVVKKEMFKLEEGAFEFIMKNPKIIKINQDGKINFFLEGENYLEKSNKIIAFLKSPNDVKL